MDAVNNLLDKCKKARELPTDMALADALHVGRAAVSGWRHGKAAPDPVACARIADLTGEPLPRVLGLIGEQRAKSAAEKKVWRRLATAAALALVFWLPALPSIASEATLTSAQSRHYAKSKRAGWAKLRRRVARIVSALCPGYRHESPTLLAA